MQRDAIDRLGVRALLLEPELMESLEPDVHLVSTLISLGSAIPETSKATARGRWSARSSTTSSGGSPTAPGPP